MTECRICKENGFPKQEIKFHGKDADDRWIINNPDGSKHQHKKQGEVEPATSTTTEEPKVVDGSKMVKLAAQGQQATLPKQQNNNGYWQHRPRIYNIQIVSVEEGNALLHMDKTLDLWNIYVINNQFKIALVNKEQASQELLADSNTLRAELPERAARSTAQTETEKDQQIASLEERIKELEPLAQKYVEANSFKPATEIKEASKEWTP